MALVPDPPPPPPSTPVREVQAVLAAAFALMVSYGWQHTAPARNHPHAGRRRLRLVDALNYASVLASADRVTHRLAFACAAMAVPLVFGVAPHALLPNTLADAYLSSSTDDETLHRLDAAIMVRLTETMINSDAEAAELLRLAGEQAPVVIAAQVRYRPQVTA